MVQEKSGAFVDGVFERDWWVMVGEVSRIVGAGEWLEEYESVQGG